MRIAVVASLVTPLREAQLGGAQAFLTDLARALAARGHEVTVYCARGSELGGVRLVTVPAPEGVERALVMPGGSDPPPPLPALRDAFGRLFEAVRADRPDAVTQHAFDAEAFELAGGLPVLHTLHLPPLVPAVVAAARACDAACVAVSEATRRAWWAAGLSGVGVLPNGVPGFAMPDERVAPRGLIAGRVSPEKGTAEAVEAARRAGLEPLVVGTVYDRDYWAREVGVPVTSVERPELWRLMAGSAVALMPVAWDEPFGMVAAEAQMAGCPVVGYRRGGLPEVVEEGVGGLLVAPGDLEELVAAVPRALALDRGTVRASALRRLTIDSAAAAYERALA
ncbi:MAG TPA: glycosyltransferase, partial [Candidatus Dormibacteraeota bacterium]|nr:glycosyltransferase [Candidatus Dormibacteraeota bacterium]